MWRGLAHVFVKAQRTTGSRLILHEYLAARLANYLGIPVPFGEISSLPGNREAWVSGITSRDGKVLPPSTYDELMKSDRHILTGIFVFDQWIFNADRHEMNLVWSEDIGLWAIDHELAFCGDREGEERSEWFGECTLQPLGMTHLRRLGLTEEDLAPWISIIRTNGKSYAERALKSAHKRGLVSQRVSREYISFLTSRAKLIESFLKRGITGKPPRRAIPAPDDPQLF
ncbi:HipA family kinase [Glutamicibacter sp. NPDC087344]|uniref:HipA family kinase n=1 Tax=Glutamicibacter sp. NPDC087344 TaxID=3363994 RepID=UPI003828D6F4